MVIIDNIGVFTTDEDLTDKWERRICLNCADLRVMLNEEETCRATFKVGTGKRDFKPKKWKQSLTFAGIEFSSEGWRSASAEKILPEDLEDPRAAAAVIGLLLWDIRVRGERLSMFPQLLQLSRLVAGARSANELIKSDEFIAEFNFLTRRRAERSFSCPARKLMVPLRVVYAATDATKDAVAWVIWDPERGGVVEFAAEIREHNENVSFQELAAVDWLVERLLERGGDPAEVRLLTDSAVVNAIVKKRFSRSQELEDLLRKMEGACGDVLRIRTSWIPSEANIADTPSRAVCRRTPSISGEETPGSSTFIEPSRFQETIKAWRDLRRWGVDFS